MAKQQKNSEQELPNIPVALDEALEQGRIQSGDILLLVAFGAGLTWGGLTLRW